MFYRHVNPEVAGSDAVLVKFSLIIPNNAFMYLVSCYMYLCGLFNIRVSYVSSWTLRCHLLHRFSDISVGIRTACIKFVTDFLMHHSYLIPDLIGKYLSLCPLLCLTLSLSSWVSLSRGQFHRAAKQRKLLTRNICLTDFLGYQPNLHVKFMYFGW